MPGTKIGGQRAAATNKLKHGDDFYRKIGKAGGMVGRGHAFGHGKVDPSEVGKIGGANSVPYSKNPRKVKS